MKCIVIMTIEIRKWNDVKQETGQGHFTSTNNNNSHGEKEISTTFELTSTWKLCTMMPNSIY